MTKPTGNYSAKAVLIATERIKEGDPKFSIHRICFSFEPESEAQKMYNVFANVKAGRVNLVRAGWVESIDGKYPGFLARVSEADDALKAVQYEEDAGKYEKEYENASRKMLERLAELEAENVNLYRKVLKVIDENISLKEKLRRLNTDQNE